MLDRTDKAILKLMLKFKEQKLSINEIAKKVDIAQITARKHLERLEEEGYIVMFEEGKSREYTTAQEGEKNAKNKDTKKH